MKGFNIAGRGMEPYVAGTRSAMELAISCKGSRENLKTVVKKLIGIVLLTFHYLCSRSIA